MERAPVEAYQPPLTAWGHTWRALLALALSAVIWLTVMDQQSTLVRTVDLALGVPCWVLVWYRRRFPLTVAWATAVLTTFSSLGAGPAVLALVSLATHRRWSQLVPLYVASVVGAQLFAVVNPPAQSEPYWFTLTSNAVAIAAMIAWGMYVGSRRELLHTLRQRAERAEAEQDLRVGQARANERARIAREMHDVLAHRISQVAMQAGALAYREDLDAEAMRGTASLIRDQSHQALTELRAVLGVLRDESGDLLDRPQPTLDDVPALVQEAQEHGLHVSLENRLDLEDSDGEVPAGVGRTVYRILQEGITNAAKHAPASLLRLQVEGSPEEGLTVTMRNPLGFGSTATPGAGLGLVGLSERAQLRGGRLEHRREDGSFVVRAWIPWTA